MRLNIQPNGTPFCSQMFLLLTEADELSLPSMTREESVKPRMLRAEEENVLHNPKMKAHHQLPKEANISPAVS